MGRAWRVNLGSNPRTFGAQSARFGPLSAELRGGLLVALVFFAGFFVASLTIGRQLQDAGHRRGACIALHMAAAHGYLDGHQQRVVTHALASAINPHLDRFSGGHARLRQTCEEIAIPE
jgi:hypothetical protein